MRISRLILAAAAGLLTAAPASAQVGTRLEEARTGDFWTAFDLQQVAMSDPPGTVMLRPRSGKVTSGVTVYAALAEDGATIGSMSLKISRELVDHPARGAFARRIVSAFLRAAMLTDDLPDVESLARAIEEAGGEPRAGDGALAVFLGGAQRWERTLEASVVVLGNEPGAAGRILPLTVAAR